MIGDHPSAVAYLQGFSAFGAEPVVLRMPLSATTAVPGRFIRGSELYGAVRGLICFPLFSPICRKNHDQQQHAPSDNDQNQVGHG